MPWSTLDTRTVSGKLKYLEWDILKAELHSADQRGLYGRLNNWHVYQARKVSLEVKQGGHWTTPLPDTVE